MRRRGGRKNRGDVEGKEKEYSKYEVSYKEIRKRREEETRGMVQYGGGGGGVDVKLIEGERLITREREREKKK